MQALSLPLDQPQPEDDDDQPSAGAAFEEAWRDIVNGSPSWLLSLVLHMLVVIVLAVWSLPSLPDIGRNLLLSEPTDANEDLDDFQEIEIDPMDLEADPVDFEIQPDTDLLAEEVSLSTFDDLAAAPSFTELSDLGLTPSAPSMPTDAMGFDGSGTTGRGKMSRTAIVRAGGSHASEEAIAQALKWLAEHQEPNGAWSLDHTGYNCQGRCSHPFTGKHDDGLRAGTGLALLPFLGAGQTHVEGKYKRVVAAGLDALTRLSKNEKNRGSSYRDPGGAGAYSHGIATIALTEAYGMTGDSALGGYAQEAVDHIIANQARDGGWRYSFQAATDNPRGIGDTSVVGWQIMALKSAHLGGLRVPPPSVVGASKFLDTVARAGGSEYVYLPGNTRTTTTLNSVGLLSRMYLGWKQDNEALQRGAEKIARAGPSPNNYYQNYYAAQVLFQYTGGKGSMWRSWNLKMRDLLIAQQEKAGHARGSWYLDGPHNDRGGRLYMTSLATMTLEVYYRYMPIFQADAVEKDFPE